MAEKHRAEHYGGRFNAKQRFDGRGGPDWVGSLIDYKEVELLRKFLTPSSKLMGRKRAGTSAAEQRDVKSAIKRARFIALIPYAGA
ncbi:MAG: 30S ribosomal protein S18 [Phycisphaerae bacterium]